MLKRIMFIILSIIIGVPVLIFIIGAMISAPGYKGSASDHFDGKNFINSTGKKAEGTWAALKWIMNRQQGEWKEDRTPAYGKHPIAQERDGIRVTFVNHSTFLIQVDGLNILTDPIWSE